MKKSFKILNNRYFIATLIFILVLFLFEDTNVFQLNKMSNQLHTLKKENDNNINLIEEVKNKTNLLRTNKQALIKFARETYYMKKEDEVVYLFK
jgi:cell division protein FtsB